MTTTTSSEQTITTSPPTTTSAPAPPPCTGETSTTIEITNVQNASGTYDVTISGVVTNGRSDTLTQVEVWFGYSGGDGSLGGGGTAFTRIDPLAAGTESSWSDYLVDQTSPAENPFVDTITYNDESTTGSYCTPYPIGGRT
jgi:hypothetical protein